MLSYFHRKIQDAVGGSQPERIEWSVFEIQNSELRDETHFTTVCLTPEVVDGRRLSFRTSPKLRNQTRGHNVLAGLRDKIDLQQGERIIIRSIVQMHTCNEVGVELRFELSHLFDHDEATQGMRDEIDMAVELDAGGRVSMPARPRFVPTTTPPAPDRQLHEDSETERIDAMLDDPDVSSSSRAAKTPEEVLERADALTFRGNRLHRNVVEKSNRLVLGPIQAEGTSCIHRTLYRCSVSDDIVRWFAGQDRIVAETPLQRHTRPNTDPATRADAPVVQYYIYPADHALVLFIDMFHDALVVKTGEKVAMRGDRDTDKLWYQLSDKLVERAREMILIVVYAQIYYTALTDCSLTRIMDRDEHEYALLLRVAARWNLPVDPVTNRVHDWAPDAYRPVVAITLRVDYTVVSGVESSAASLHKKRTRLRVV